MSGLEQQLAALRNELAWPDTPTFALELAPAPSRSRRLRPLVVALAVALVAATGVLAFSPGARSAFLELFRLDGATVIRLEELPQVELVAPDLGVRVSLAEAERRVGFEVLELPGLGEPDAVHVRENRVVSLVWGPDERPRLVLSQLDGAVYHGFEKKVAGSGTRVEDVTVGGERGLFVSGDEHFVLWLEDGAVQDGRTWLAGNVLLWNRGPLLLRLEADVSRDEAVALAESVE